MVNSVKILSFDDIRNLCGDNFRYIPNGGNMGDALIVHGEYRFFEDYGLNYQDKSSDALLVHGGGGGLIEGYYTVVADVLEPHCKRNRDILILPSTIKGHTDFFNKYSSQFTIIVRDKISYTSLRESGFPPEKLYLAHDMAFYLFEIKIQENYRFLPPLGTLLALRIDSESAQTGNIDGSMDLSAQYGSGTMGMYEVEAVVKYMLLFLSIYSVVITDRLHVGIACSILGKKCYMMRNSYYKNRAIFELSIQGRFDCVEFVDSIDDVPQSVLEDVSKHVDSNLIVSNLTAIKDAHENQDGIKLEKFFYQKVLHLSTCFVPTVKLRRKIRAL